MSDANPCSNTWLPVKWKVSLDLSKRVIKLSFFSFWICLSFLGHTEESIVAKRPHVWQMNCSHPWWWCVCVHVWIQSANTPRSGTSPVAVCSRCRGEPLLGQCLCLYRFPVPETDGHCLLQRKRKQRKAKQEETADFATKRVKTLWPKNCKTGYPNTQQQNCKPDLNKNTINK